MHYRRGFTLVEIMVVVFIIGVILSFIVVNPRAFMTSPNTVKIFVQETALRLKFAKEQAITTQSLIGFSLKPTSWKFYEFVDNQWELLDRPQPLRPGSAPRDITMRVTGNDTNDPQIVFYPTGELSPFILECELNRQGYRGRITGLANGEISIDKSS